MRTQPIAASDYRDATSNTARRTMQRVSSARSQRERDDQPRLLAKRSEHAYTANPGDAMADEPEAVSDAYQRYITREAHRDEQRRKLAAVIEATEVVDHAIDSVLRAAGRDHRAAVQARAVRRAMRGLARAVAAG